MAENVAISLLGSNRNLDIISLIGVVCYNMLVSDDENPKEDRRNSKYMVSLTGPELGALISQQRKSINI
jgi:hypothetical protein